MKLLKWISTAEPKPFYRHKLLRTDQSALLKVYSPNNARLSSVYWLLMERNLRSVGLTNIETEANGKCVWLWSRRCASSGIPFEGLGFFVQWHINFRGGSPRGWSAGLQPQRNWLRNLAVLLCSLIPYTLSSSNGLNSTTSSSHAASMDIPPSLSLSLLWSTWRVYCGSSELLVSWGNSEVCKLSPFLFLIPFTCFLFVCRRCKIIKDWQKRQEYL